MAVAIRQAEPGEEARLVPAYEWLFAPPGSTPRLWDPERGVAALRQAIASSDSAVLVAVEEGGDLVGFCTAYQELFSVRFGHRVWVEDLAVHPARRSEGIGKRLLDAAKDWAREQGATHLELDSAETRADAHRFYEREGPSWRGVSLGWEL
ncbi:MAG: GNAT family N-acetyltransferase [Solirubrobacterales bacterium]